MPRVRLMVAVTLAMVGCNEPAPARRVPDSERSGTIEGGQHLAAAGIAMTVPDHWRILASDEPNFAQAVDLTSDSPQPASCAIELRRQGVGPLAPTLRRAPPRPEAPDVVDYSGGLTRGRLKAIPGPADSEIVVHCWAPRASGQWPAIAAAFESLRNLDTRASLPEVVADAAVVDLCVQTPARRTEVCVLRSDGAVHCGASTGSELEPVAGLPTVTAISCSPARVCALDEAGGVWCWREGEAPVARADGHKVTGIVGACVIAGGGVPFCPLDEDPAGARPTIPTLVELQPLGALEHALSGVTALLPGSDFDRGCAAIGERVRCWDRADALPIEIADEGVVEVADLSGPPGEVVDALAWWGRRLCAGTDGRWRCVDGTGERWTLDGCQRRSCGCSLVGSQRFSCEDRPIERIDRSPVGRIDDVVVSQGACAAQRDGAVICRGAGPGEDEHVGGRPGVAHRLR